MLPYGLIHNFNNELIAIESGRKKKKKPKPTKFNFRHHDMNPLHVFGRENKERSNPLQVFGRENRERGKKKNREISNPLHVFGRENRERSSFQIKIKIKETYLITTSPSNSSGKRSSFQALARGI